MDVRSLLFTSQIGVGSFVGHFFLENKSSVLGIHTGVFTLEENTSTVDAINGSCNLSVRIISCDKIGSSLAMAKFFSQHSRHI